MERVSSTTISRIMYWPLPVLSLLSRLLKCDSRKENLRLPASRQLVQAWFCPNCRRKILPRFLEPGLDRKLRLLRCQQNHVTYHFRHLLFICGWRIARENSLSQAQSVQVLRKPQQHLALFFNIQISLIFFIKNIWRD